MTEQEIVHKIHQAIISAKKSLDSAEGWFEMLLQNENIDYESIKESIKKEKVILMSEDENIHFGIFDGKKMLSDSGDSYPVPENYASKSKLIEGDRLKLTIQDNGALHYKQIELAPRLLKTGKLILEGSQYKVLTDDSSYKVLYASVTFFRGSVGDTVTVIVPEDVSKEWAAIENVIPE